MTTTFDSVKSAIIYRIATQHSALLAKFGPEAVLEAIEAQAMFVGDVEEIGSSDISCWVTDVIRALLREETRLESIYTTRALPR